MARLEKKMSVHFEESIVDANNKSIDPDYHDDPENQIQLKEISTRKLSYTYRLSQVVFRRKKSRFSETSIVVTAILVMIFFLLAIVSWLVFSESSTMRITRIQGRQGGK